jgi:hypothetical protein
MFVEAEIYYILNYQLFWYFHVLILHSISSPYFMYHDTSLHKIINLQHLHTIIDLFKDS